MAKKTPKPKKKILTTILIAELLDLQSQLIKDHDAIPGKAGYLNWSPQLGKEWKTKQKLLLKEKKKLEIEFKNSKKEEDEQEDKLSIKTGFKALGTAAALGGDTEMSLATVALVSGIGKKIFSGISNLFKKKDKKTEEDKNLDQSSPKSIDGSPEKVNKDAMDPKKIALLGMAGAAGAGGDHEMSMATNGLIAATLGFGKKKKDKDSAASPIASASPMNRIGAPEKIIKESPSDAVRSFYERGGAQPKEYSLTPGAPEKIESKPGFLMSAEEKIRAREERINSEKVIPAGAPEKIESKKENISSDNDAIISILNKILASFQADNERMRRSIRGSEEKKLESDPTPDTPGAPIKEGDDKKSGMNKLLMFGAIAGLLGLAYTFKDEIAKVLEPITDMLGITNPLKESDKEDYEFDIMDALGVTALLGMLGITPTPGSKPGTKAGESAKAGSSEKANTKSNVRERHPAGAKNKAGKSIGGQFKTALPKEGITTLIKKRVAGAAGKIIPGLGLALGLYDAYDRAMKGDVVGASLAAGGGAVGLLPGIGTGVSIAAAAANIARDVYNEAYGVFPEEDEGGNVAKNLKSIMDETIESLTNKKPGPPMTDADKDKLAGPLAAYALGLNGDPKNNIPKAPLIRRQKLASDVYKEAGRLKIPREVVETELGEARDAAAGQNKAADSLKALQNSAATAKADSAAEASAPAEPSAAGGAPSAPAGGASSSPEASSSSSGMPSASGAPGSPVPSAPPPASETSGSAIASATMESSAAQNTVTVLPPIINNQTNTSSSNPARESKANKISMQIRMEDEMFRTAINATAAVLKTLKAA